MSTSRERRYARQETVRRVGRVGLWLLVILVLNGLGWTVASLGPSLITALR